MKAASFITFLICTIAIVSCKKDYPIEKNSFNGDTSIFVGTWNWIYSEHDYGWCDPPSQFEVVTPTSAGYTFKIMFLENGLVSFYKDNILYNDFRITSIWFKDDNFCDLQDSYHYGLGINKMAENYLFGCINTDTLLLFNFPGFILHAEPGCEDYRNYFIKE
jgi:hypothetical protein